MRRDEGRKLFLIGFRVFLGKSDLLEDEVGDGVGEGGCDGEVVSLGLETCSVGDVGDFVAFTVIADESEASLVVDSFATVVGGASSLNDHSVV